VSRAVPFTMPQREVREENPIASLSLSLSLSLSVSLSLSLSACGPSHHQLQNTTAQRSEQACSMRRVPPPPSGANLRTLWSRSQATPTPPTTDQGPGPHTDAQREEKDEREKKHEENTKREKRQEKFPWQRTLVCCVFFCRILLRMQCLFPSHPSGCKSILPS
jgi:hypothetical protein